MDSSAQPPGLLRHREAELNGVRLHWVEAGDGPLVLLLHGFPDFWYTWRRQLPAIAAGGFRAVAPDLRGYGLSGRPRGLGAYRMDVLAADVAALVGHLGAERASVVGHDWGGAIAWNLPRYEPGLVERLVILNSPHPRAFAREIRTADQLRRSWYIFFFQLPLVPEALLGARGHALLERPFRRLLRKGALTAEDLALYREAWARPGALTAMLDYYRAAFRRRPPRRPSRIETPALLVWGERDPFLGPRLTEGLERWVPDLRVERIPAAGHWVHLEEPERVNRLILDFLGERR